MAKSNSTVAPINPLIVEDDPLETLENVKGSIEFLMTAAGSLSEGDETRGLTLALQGAADALDHARQELTPKAVNHE